jgi:hypothetical protein
MKRFEAVGQDVEARWRQANYDHGKFAEIAVDALRRARLPSKLGPTDVLKWVLDDTPLAPQFDIGGRFGEPPITVYSNSRFFIDVLFWNDGTTSVHEHSFSGAFQVLSGSSVHGVYEFEPEQRVSSAFALGELRLKHMELLTRGDLRPIRGGRGFIHSLFHLDRPSTTIVLRTRQDVEHGTQLSYLFPSVAHGPFAQDERTIRRLDALGALRTMGELHYFKTLTEQAAKMELPLLFLALHRHYRVEDLPHMQAMLATARKRHGRRAVDRVLAAVEDDRRKDWIIRARKRAHGPELRFFLAVMLNAPDRKTALRLVRARYPRRDARALIVRWLDQLAELPSLDARFENALEIPFGDHTPRVIELVMRDASLPQVRRALAREYEGVEEQREELRSLYDKLRAHPLLGVWWR